MAHDAGKRARGELLRRADARLRRPHLPRAADAEADRPRLSLEPPAPGEPDSVERGDVPPRHGDGGRGVPGRPLRGPRSVVPASWPRAGDPFAAGRGALPHAPWPGLARLGGDPRRPPGRGPLVRGRAVVVEGPGRAPRRSHGVGSLPGPPAHRDGRGWTQSSPATCSRIRSGRSAWSRCCATGRRCAARRAACP